MDSNPANNEMTAFLESFRNTIDDGSARLLEIPDDESATPPGEGKWSPKEIIGHLIDSAANNHQRFVRAQFSDDLVFSGYQQEEWVDAQRYRERPWREMVQLWQLYNRHILHIMKVTPETTRMKLRHKHNLHVIASESLKESEPVTLDYFMRDYVEHLRKHLGQIFDGVTQSTLTA
jgi:hypothetical protein